jgi:hypothetical protein
MRPWLSIIFPLLIISIVPLALDGCGTQVEPLPVSELAVVKTISITPSSPNVAVTGSTQFHAIAGYTDGSTADITSAALWTSGTAAVASLEGHGLLTCKTVGSSTVSASAGGVIAVAPLVCSGPVLPQPVLIKTLAIAPSSSTVAVTGSTQFHAIASYWDGSTADLTSTATWATSVAAVAPLEGQGLLICKTAGISNVSASAAGVIAIAPLTCSGPQLPPPIVIKTIAITPSSTNVLVPDSTQFHAIASYSDGTTADITSTMTWTSSIAAVALSEGGGLLLCKAAGISIISASAGGVPVTASLTCSPPLPVVIKTITMTPLSLNVRLTDSAQLHATASYTDGSTADVTSAATWTTSVAAVATLSNHGLLLCVTSGTSNISVSDDGVVATIPLTCSGPQIVDVKFVTTPSVIRSNAPFAYQLHAAYADGTSTDVTAKATWASDPSVASITSGGLVNCNHPGTATIAGAFAGKRATAPFTCVLRSISPRPGFVESAKTFDGPFASWVNVKTAFGAKGDGVADDTAALQAALNSLAGNRAVLWIPGGTYRITGPLAVTGLENITILGEDPRTTTISWAGPAGGTMLTLSGCDGFNVGRLTLDGRYSSGVNLEVTWDESSNYYPTRNLIHDSRIINTQTGIHAGFAGETTIDRVHFDHNTQAGLSLGTYNTLNWNVLDSLFTDNAIGVTNWYGAGGFVVTNSVFVRSTTADVKIGNTGSFSLRNNLSVDSMKFFATGQTGAPANIILQGNTIFHPGSSPVATGTPGTLMILDNQFLDLDSSFNILYSFGSPANFISVGNTYAVSQPYGGNIGRYTSVDDETAGPTSSTLPWAVPTEVYIPPFSHRQVFEVVPGSSDVAIQAAIDAATAVSGIVHIPEGNFNIFKTVEISPNANVGILGDGALSNLVAESSLKGPALVSYGKTFQLEDVGFWSYSPSPSDAMIELHVPDDPSTHILCDECAFIYQVSSAVESNGFDDAAIEFRVPGLNATVSADVHGGTGRQNGKETLGRFGEFMSSSSAYHVDLGGHLLAEDGFHDIGQGNIQFVLTGDGSVTQEGGAIEVSANPAMALNNYKGQISLLGVETNSYLNIGLGSPANVFVAAVIQGTGISPLLNSEPGAVVVGLSNKSTPDNGGTLTELLDTPTTPGNIERRMSMARTQVLSQRTPIAFDSTIVKMTRILVRLGGVGLRLVNSTPSRIAGGYSIASTNGTASPQSGCPSGKITIAGTWTLQDGGDGFLGLATKGAILSEDIATQSDGSALKMSGAMSSARDRWFVEQVGDGSVTIANRATGDLLTQAPGGCVYAAKSSTSASQHWLVNGTS